MIKTIASESNYSLESSCSACKKSDISEYDDLNSQVEDKKHFLHPSERDVDLIQDEENQPGTCKVSKE